MDLEVWVVFPETERGATAAVRKKLRTECHRRSWRIQEKTSRMHRLGGRPLQLVTGADAANLYRRAHRVRMAVFVAGQPFVPLNPEVPVRPKDTLQLRRFVRYKAYARRLPTNTIQVSSHLDSCEMWGRSIGCESGHDPRCLPFHVFDTRRRQLNLDEIQHRQVFDNVHGSGPRRCDKQGLTWSLDPKAYHGGEELQVAGYRLPRGFHWDVSVPGGPKVLTTGTDRWKVFRYVNIAPDAHFRGREPHARRINRRP